MKRVHLALISASFIALIMSACEERETTKQPSACFAVSNETVEVGETVIFTNCSEDAKTYKWDFKDGNTSVAENPTHAFSVAGTYPVKLEAWNNNLADEVEKTITVTSSGGSIRPEIWDGISYDYYTEIYGTTFDEAGSWITGSTAEYSFSVSNGYYTMYRSGAGFSAVSLNDFVYSGNYELETKFKITNYTDTYNNGLIWGLDEGITNWKFLNTSADGYYLIGQYKNEAYNKWVDWTTGANTSPSENLLTVRVYNNQFYMFLNKTLVYQGSSIYSDNGPFWGFFISSGTTIVSDFFYLYDINTSGKKSGNTQKITRDMLRVNTPNKGIGIEGKATNSNLLR